MIDEVDLPYTATPREVLKQLNDLGWIVVHRDVCPFKTQELADRVYQSWYHERGSAA